MKKISKIIPVLGFMILSLCGCNAIGQKSASLTTIYATTALLSLLLLLCCLFMLKKMKSWFILLFSSVFVVNTGYTILSLSSTLEMALHANRIAYLGSVFLPLSMLMIILDATNTKYQKRTPILLFCVSILVFLIAASPGILDIYYKEVSLQTVNGVSELQKEYGILHPLYLFYLIGYFSAMTTVIIKASVKKRIDSSIHAVILLIAVLVNIGVWLIEQLVSIEFEMLSVSYIISELFLLGVHLVINENQRLKKIVKQVESVQNFSEKEDSSAKTMLDKPIQTKTIDPQQLELFVNGVEKLTPTEREVYKAHIARVTTKEIMANLNIKENTLKYHNKNLYGKLGVSSKKELLEVYKHLKAVKSNLEDATKQ